MSSNNDPSPPAKRARADASGNATARESAATSPVAKGHARVSSFEGHDASRLKKTNEALGKQVFRMQKTIEKQNVRIARLERDFKIQRGVIRTVDGLEELVDQIIAAADERTSSQESSGDGSSQESLSRVEASTPDDEEDSGANA